MQELCAVLIASASLCKPILCVREIGNNSVNSRGIKTDWLHPLYYTSTECFDLQILFNIQDFPGNTTLTLAFGRMSECWTACSF
jgi:hypothetical protein